jgi:NitT/TauT family transport system substrate-binding protein
MALVGGQGGGWEGDGVKEGRRVKDQSVRMKHLTLLLFLLIGFMFSGSTSAQDKEVFVYHTRFLHMESVGHHVAEEKGFYGKVSVKEVRGTAGMSPIQGVAASVRAGDIAFGVDYPENLIRAREKDRIALIALSVDFQNSAMRIISWIPIKSSRELKGDFGIWASHDSKAKCAAGKGWEKQLTLLNQGERIDPWLSGKWPMASAMTFHELIIAQREVKRMRKKFYTIDYKDFGFDWMDNVLFTTEEIAQNHPDLVQTVVTGRYKGFHWAFRNPGEALEILKKNHGDLNPAHEMDAMDPIKLLMVTPDTKRLGLGHILPKKWEKVAGDMLKAGLLDKMPDVKNIYTEKFPSGVLPK